MKILLVTEFFPSGKDLKFSGGVEARTFFLAKYLAKRHKVLVICSREKNTKYYEKFAGINIYRVGPFVKYDAGANFFSIKTKIGFIFSAIKAGAELKPDIVDGGNFIANFIAKQIAKKNKIPVVFWYPDVFIRNWIRTSGLFAGLAGSILEKINLLRSADYFIAISNSTKNKLLKLNVPSQKISVIPCGVELAEFKFSIPKSKTTTLICISRLVSYKRINDLIWAFALIHKKNKKLKLKIIGRGPEKKKLQNICKMLKISRNVSFKSNLSRKELIKNIKSSYLFCLPSKVEGFGVSVIEAAAAGVPYVISNIDVFKEITKNGQGGLFFKVGNINNFASKIKNLISDKNLYRKKVVESSQLVKNYKWTDIAQKTESIYLSQIKNNERSQN